MDWVTHLNIYLSGIMSERDKNVLATAQVEGDYVVLRG